MTVKCEECSADGEYTLEASNELTGQVIRRFFCAEHGERVVNGLVADMAVFGRPTYVGSEDVADAKAVQECIELYDERCDCDGPRPTIENLKDHWLFHAATCPYFVEHKRLDDYALKLVEGFNRQMVAPLN